VSDERVRPRRIAILSQDTRGGVQPYIALALGLQHAGHTVQMIAPASSVDLIEAHGLWVSPLTGDVQAALRSSGGAAEKGSFASIQYARRESARHVAIWMREALAACDGVDLITGGVGGMIIGESVAEKLRVPFIQTHLQPVCAPTDAYPGVLFPNVPRFLGGLGRRLSHTASEAALWMPFRRAIEQGRRDVLGLPAVPRNANRSLPVLYGYSRHVVPRPATWSAERIVTGYWSLPRKADWTPSRELCDFIQSGMPPVCIGFGSMSSENAATMTQLVTKAVELAGVRAVLLSGWGGLAPIDNPNVFVAEELPHDWLFPQMAAVIHHGGAGTTGAACTAGVPSLVVPFTMDQPFWGSRIELLGVGPAPIPRKQLSVERLTAGIEAAVTDDVYRSNASALGAAIRAEDGVGTAVRAFQSLPASATSS
jgi:sterol 3beta-glucosyltransferase